MALSLASISKKATIRAPRMVVLGVEKIGKSSFACGCSFEDGKLTKQGQNSPIVLPIKGEEGVDALDVASFPTLRSYTDVLDAVGVLYREQHDYRTAVVDSVSALERLVWAYVCQQNNVDSIEKVGGGYGKGYGEAADAFGLLLDGLDALRAEKNMASILIGHVKVKRFDDPAGPAYDQYQFDVNEKIANMLCRWADLILFAGTKVSVQKEDVGFKKEKSRGTDVTGGQRFLFTQKRPAHPGGGRGFYGQLPYELPLDYTAFTAAVAAAMASNVNS
jgi:hypothetical protein